MIRQALARELPGREVDAHAQRLVFGIVLGPGPDLVAGFSQAPVANGEDQAGVLGQGNEVHGRQQAAFRVLPSNESFEPHDFQTAQLHHRLVVEDKLAAVDGAAEIRVAQPRTGTR